MNFLKSSFPLTHYRLQNAIFIFFRGCLILNSQTASGINTALKKIISGLSIPQQYVCIALEDLHSPLSVTLTLADENFAAEVTQKHLFVGYKPVVIGITLPADKISEALDRAGQICLNFHQHPFVINSRWHGFSTDKSAVARLILKRIYEKSFANDRVLFFEGLHGKHSFISPWHQFINAQRERLKRNTAGNVDLPGNLHEMVRIAYAIPRVIPVITLSDGSSMNMFPTDLHGAVSPGVYISSLRIGGKANAQVGQLKKLALSTMDVSAFREVYALGKNHMQELRAPDLFSCSPHRSKVYGLPLPLHATAYRELVETGSFDTGIHRIHFYEQEHEEKLNDGRTLAHIHQYYAQWRFNLGLPTNMLLR